MKKCKEKSTGIGRGPCVYWSWGISWIPLLLPPGDKLGAGQVCWNAYPQPNSQKYPLCMAEDTVLQEVLDWLRPWNCHTHTHTHTHTEKGKTQMPPLWTQLYVTFITRFTLWIWNILCTVLWNWLIPTKCQCNAKTNNANLWNKITILFQTSLEF